ncbi:MAG TPA: ABC transporter ATP-binding protein [Solirubrobacteraceae bacterium]|nr:ABC transporter ATP-binding protein [Solirubrobacteraceae bacterium]
MAAITVRDLYKSYGSLEVLHGISFDVEDGEVFALLGPNGAGKTTTLEILEGHRRRSAGLVTVLGHDPQSGSRRLHERVGIVLQSAGLDGELSVWETVSMYAGWYPRSLAVSDVIDRVGLQTKRRARVKTLSGGQRRRLDLAVALVGDPELIFLDEPTTGFDPEARREAWSLVEDLRGLGRTILLTSHYMDEVQHLADRAVILAQGQIVAHGRPDRLGTTSAYTVISFALPEAGLREKLPGLLRRQARSRGGQFVIRTDDPTHTLLTLCGWATEHGVALRALEVTRPSLEDVYLEVTANGTGAP